MHKYTLIIQKYNFAIYIYMFMYEENLITKNDTYYLINSHTCMQRKELCLIYFYKVEHSKAAKKSQGFTVLYGSFFLHGSFFIKSLSSPYFLLNKFFCEQVDGDNVIPLPQQVSLGNAMKEYEIHKDNTSSC